MYQSRRASSHASPEQKAGQTKKQFIHPTQTHPSNGITRLRRLAGTGDLSGHVRTAFVVLRPNPGPQVFDLGTLVSPFVALVFAACTGLANFLGTRKFGRKTLPFIVAACGFAAGAATVGLFNRLAPTVLDHQAYWTGGTVFLAGAAGAVVFILLGMIVWRIRRPRTLLET